jgi:hypothetical protein
MSKKLESDIFIIASCLELLMGLLKECDYEFPFARYVLWGCMIVYMLVMCRNAYTNKEKAIFLGIMCIGVILYISSGINTCIKAIIYIFALKKIDKRLLYRCLLGTLIVVIAGSVASNFLFGVVLGDGIGDYCLKKGFDGYTFGFCNPNRFQVEMFALMVFSLWQWNDGQNIWIRIQLGILYFITCILSDSYTGLLVGGFIYLMFWILKYIKWDKWKNVFMTGIYLSIITFLIISIIAAAGVRGGIIDNINHFISGRMDQLLIWNNEEICLTGELANWRLFATKLYKNVYDLGYVQLFYYYGYVPAICYLLFVFYSVYVAWRDNKVVEMLVLWGFAIYLFMEAAYFSNYLQRDFLLMTAAYIVMEDGSIYEKNTISSYI